MFERLDKARALVLHELAHTSITAPAYINMPSQANFMAIEDAFWHSSPINHRIAVDDLTMMEVQEVESTCFIRCAKELLQTLSKANHHEDVAGIFCRKTQPHEEISMTAILTEVVARTLDSSDHGLRWYHQLQDTGDGVVDVALYAVREKGKARNLLIPCAIFETGMHEPLDWK